MRIKYFDGIWFAIFSDEFSSHMHVIKRDEVLKEINPDEIKDPAGKWDIEKYIEDKDYRLQKKIEEVANEDLYNPENMVTFEEIVDTLRELRKLLKDDELEKEIKERFKEAGNEAVNYLLKYVFS